MLSYSDGLLQRFLSAKKRDLENLDYKEFRAEYNNWLHKNKIYGDMYVKILENKGLNFDSKTCAEVGKCGLDFVTCDYDTTIITNARETFPDSVQYRIMDGEFSVPKTALNSFFETNSASYGDYIDRYIDTFMTQNPYRIDDIKDWPNLYGCYLKDIIVGMYGELNDHDAALRYEQLKAIKYRMPKRECYFEYIKNDDCWFAFLASKHAFCDAEKSNDISVKRCGRKIDV